MPVRLFRLALALAFAALVAACAAPRAPMAEFPQRLGAMQLGHVVIVADNATVSPVSRRASAEEWQAALDKAFRDRFGRNEGSQWFHLGLHVDGFALAPPGIPLIASPRSVLILSATLWDDARGGKVNDTPRQFTLFESLSGATALGSGLFRSREQQMEALAFNAALEVEKWLLENPQWFPDPALAAAADPALAAAAGSEAPVSPADLVRPRPRPGA